MKKIYIDFVCPECGGTSLINIFDSVQVNIPVLGSYEFDSEGGPDVSMELAYGQENVVYSESSEQEIACATCNFTLGKDKIEAIHWLKDHGMTEELDYE